MDRRPVLNGRVPNRRGTAIVLVVLAIAVAFVLGLTFLSNATTATGVADLMLEHAQARQIAETGILLALRSTEENQNWRATESPGTWINGQDVIGGKVSVTAAFEPDAGPELIDITDSSFEQEVSELPTPPVNPPMSGVIGGWEIERDALVITGLTVPRMGVVANPDTTDGGNEAFIAFDIAVTGSATFAQTLTDELEPRHGYTLKVDIAPVGVLPLDERYGFRLLAGAEVVASTETAVTLEDMMAEPDAEALVESLNLDGTFFEHSLHFLTDDDPPSGPLRVEVFAEVSGLLMEIAFDHVRLEVRSNEPLTLTSIGRYGDGSKISTVSLIADLDGSAKIVDWQD